MRTITVGYDYQSRKLCDECIREPAMQQSTAAGLATMWGDCGSSEDIIGEWALAIGLDWDDETSFDSADFPKRVTEDQAHDVCSPANGYPRGQCGDRCGQCGNPLGYRCPNIDDEESR